MISLPASDRTAENVLAITVGRGLPRDTSPKGARRQSHVHQAPHRGARQQTGNRCHERSARSRLAAGRLGHCLDRNGGLDRPSWIRGLETVLAAPRRLGWRPRSQSLASIKREGARDCCAFSKIAFQRVPPRLQARDSARPRSAGFIVFAPIRRALRLLNVVDRPIGVGARRWAEARPAPAYATIAATGTAAWRQRVESRQTCPGRQAEKSRRRPDERTGL